MQAQLNEMLASLAADVHLQDRLSQQFDAVSSYLESADGDWLQVQSQAEAAVRQGLSQAQKLMAPWNSVDVIAWLRWYVMPNAETYQESTFDRSSAVVELASAILLTRDGDQGVQPTVDRSPSLYNDRLPPPSAVPAQVMAAQVHATLRQVIDEQGFAVLARAAQSDNPQRTGGRVLGRELALRNPGYQHLTIRHLQEQFSVPAAAALLDEHLGFTIYDALAVVDVLDQILIHGTSEAAQTIVNARPRRRVTKGAEGRMDSRDGEKPITLSHLERDTAFAILGRHVALTGDKIATRAGVEISRVLRVLTLLSRGYEPHQSDALAHAHSFMGGENPWRLRPVLACDGGRYIAVSAGQPLFALREAIERDLPEAARPAYAKSLAEWMESVAVDCLSALLRPDEVYRNVEYVDSSGRAVELDALLVVDRVALAIEAKGTSLSARARTGDPVRLRRDIERIVTKTLEQADRVRSSIYQSGQIMRRGLSGPINLQQVVRVFPIALTLEDVSSMAGLVSELIDEGYVDFAGNPPWLVSLHDLVVITEIVDNPALFLAYLDQHERVVSLGTLSVAEELDVVMLFLQEGLWLKEASGVGQTPERFLLPSRTDALDAYYFHVTGTRSRSAPKPSQQWNPVGFMSVLDFLTHERPGGWTTAAINLQTIGREPRKRLASLGSRLQRRCRLDDLPHDEAAVFGLSTSRPSGITGLSIPRWTPEEMLRPQLLDLVSRQSKRHGATSWTGLGYARRGKERPLALVQVDALPVRVNAAPHGPSGAKVGAGGA